MSQPTHSTHALLLPVPSPLYGSLNVKNHSRITEGFKDYESLITRNCVEKWRLSRLPYYGVKYRITGVKSKVDNLYCKSEKQLIIDMRCSFEEPISKQ